jgi:tetratricopeptide (TPR) repeat protein
MEMNNPATALQGLTAARRIALLWVVALAAGAVSTSAAAPLDPAAKARTFTALGDHRRAAGLYQQILDGVSEQDQAPLEIHRGLAGALWMAGDAIEALGAATRALELYPEDAALLRVAGGIHASQGQYATAIERLYQAALLDPGQAADHANLGGLYTSLGRYDEAEAALLRAATLAPEDAVVSRRLGALYLKRHRFVEARQQLEQAARLDSTSPTTFYFLGQALEGLSDSEPALAQYDRARQLDPSYLDAHYRVAQLARRLDRPTRADSALAEYQHLQDVGGGDVDALKQMRLLRDAIVESGEQTDHIFALARFLLAYDYLDEAQNRFEAVLHRRPGDYQTLNQLGNIHLKRRSPDLALERYEEALGIAPEFTPAALNAGNASMLLRRPDRARTYYERVVSLAPDVAMGWFGLGSSHLELGQPGSAVRIYEQGLERSRPEGRTRKAFLEQLRKARRALESR